MESDIKQQFGERIRSLREKRSLSQENLAFLVGVHRTYLGGIERGERNVSLHNIKRIAQAFEMTISQLMEGIE